MQNVFEMRENSERDAEERTTASEIRRGLCWRNSGDFLLKSEKLSAELPEDWEWAQNEEIMEQ